MNGTQLIVVSILGLIISIACFTIAIKLYDEKDPFSRVYMGGGIFISLLGVIICSFLIIYYIFD